MDYIEIVLRNIKSVQIEDVFYDCVAFDEKDIISSHFFDKKKDKDISYQEVESLKEYFYVPGTCKFYLKKAMIGIGLENVLIHIGCDEGYGDITINFDEVQFRNHKNQDIADKLQKILFMLQKIYKSGRVEEIILGYEPADDADMKILVIVQNQMRIFNENIFKSPFANAIYLAAKNIQV